MSIPIHNVHKYSGMMYYIFKCDLDLYIGNIFSILQSMLYPKCLASINLHHKVQKNTQILQCIISEVLESIRVTRGKSENTKGGFGNKEQRFNQYKMLVFKCFFHLANNQTPWSHLTVSALDLSW